MRLLKRGTIKKHCDAKDKGLFNPTLPSNKWGKVLIIRSNKPCTHPLLKFKKLLSRQLPLAGYTKRSHK